MPPSTTQFPPPPISLQQQTVTSTHGQSEQQRSQSNFHMNNQLIQSQAQVTQNTVPAHQFTTGYRLPIYPTNFSQQMSSIQPPPGYNPYLMPPMWSQSGYPPPLPQPQFSYTTPLQQPPPQCNSTPSSGGFAQGMRRLSYDANLSPALSA